MNFILSGGTDQQRQWFNDATDEMTREQFPFDNFATDVTVTWVAESVLQNESHSYGRFTFALTRYNGGTDTATLQIFEGLDTRADDEFQGKGFYMETVAHEIGHVVSGRLDDATIGQICALFNEHADAWQTGGWETRIVEGCSEIIKDTYQRARKFENRTTRFISKENFAQLMTLLGLIGSGAFTGGFRTLGAPLGQYNAPDSTYGSGGGPGPGWIYGVTLDAPGQPALRPPTGPVSYDYILLPNIDPVSQRPYYPFVYFWALLDHPRNWKLTLLIAGGNVGPFTEENPGGVLPPPDYHVADFTWGGPEATILFGDLVNIVEFPGRWSGEYPVAGGAVLAETCMTSGTPFLDYRDWTGMRGFNDNEPDFPFDAMLMSWEWDEGIPPDPPPWPYHDPELALGLGGHALRPKRPHIIGPAGPETSLR